MQLQKNKNLQPFNTLAVPSRAEYFVEVSSERQLEDALEWAKQKQKKVVVLGGGSNVILAENISGLVIHIAVKGRQLNEDGEFKKVTLSAGENWHHSIEWMLAHSCNGLENLALIPGTVGAAPVQNVGAYGVELADYFYQLTALNIRSLETQVFSKRDCSFAYRDSIFKGAEQNSWVITSVELHLPSAHKPNIAYPALKNLFDQMECFEPSARQVFDAACKIRSNKLPAPGDIPNAGSFFKNPVVDQEQHINLKRQWPGLVSYELSANQYKLAAGWLIDNAGWRGKQGEACCMHQQQALVLCNPNRRSGHEVLAFAELVREDIRKKYQLELEIEPQALG